MEVDDSVTALSMEPMEYFPHDALAAQDIKCKRLLLRHGTDGYGKWWLLCEFLARSKGHIYHINDEEDLLILADTIMCENAQECIALLDDLADIGLIEPDAYKDGIVGNERMGRNSQRLAKKRLAGKQAVEAREKKRAERKKKLEQDS